MKFEKGPGWDWLAKYEDENGVEDSVLVFGKITIEDALKEVRYSLNAFVPFEGAIISIERIS